ncbi:hypothetical protein NQ317_008517 [Molorchus minor]|uniref:Uncharacterized protein n=1 Tax=Molorchus minor TaxID=1323400 RepID=A0ABQ9J4S2_9CUCU|nr:hypothetical protein NQ317_008517 [Molorchus minor]
MHRLKKLYIYKKSGIVFFDIPVIFYIYIFHKVQKNTLGTFPLYFIILYMCDNKTILNKNVFYLNRYLLDII